MQMLEIILYEFNFYLTTTNLFMISIQVPLSSELHDQHVGDVVSVGDSSHSPRQCDSATPRYHPTRPSSLQRTARRITAVPRHLRGRMCLMVEFEFSKEI